MFRRGDRVRCVENVPGIEYGAVGEVTEAWHTTSESERVIGNDKPYLVHFDGILGGTWMAADELEAVG